MTRVLRSTAKKYQIKNDISSKLSSNPNSKAIKRRVSKTVEEKSQDNQPNDMWNINSILSNIFAYTDYKDLVEFNTVSKRWNYLTNQVIRNNMKLVRSWDIIKKIHDKRFNKAAKIDAEVEECISTNSKYVVFVKEFRFCEKLEPQRSIEFFENFKFITNLTIEGVAISQDQFLGMVNPLTQLIELSLVCVSIKKIYRKRLYKKVVQLPPSLKKLTVGDIYLIDNPELFVQTINSHINLVKFSYKSYTQYELLEPFYKNYPSLTSFEYSNQEVDNSQDLLKIFKVNPQLITLKLVLKFWNNTLADCINSHLVSLEEFNITEISKYGKVDSSVLVKFSRPTKIKKLRLEWDKFSKLCLESILANCPELEELILNYHRYSSDTDYQISLNLKKPTKIKKLEIICDSLSNSSLQSILLNCPQLKSLDIQFYKFWEEWMKLIGSSCINLEKLIIYTSYYIYGDERKEFYKELYEKEFLTANSNYKSTLTHLTIKGANFYELKPQYFNNFKNLKSIKFPAQSKNQNSESSEDFKLDMNLWPNYRLIKKEGPCNIDIELIKLRN